MRWRLAVVEAGAIVPRSSRVLLLVLAAVAPTAIVLRGHGKLGFAPGKHGFVYGLDCGRSS